MTNPYNVNPTGFCYTGVAGAAAYNQPNAMLITGQDNSADPAFAAARAVGAEVLRYVDPVSIVLQPGGADSKALYGPALADPTMLLPWGLLSSWTNTLLANINVGSAWAARFIAYCQVIISSGTCDGLFIDELGAKLWEPAVGFDTWPQSSKDAWTNGAVDIVRQLDGYRRRANPKFILMSNNNWDRGDNVGLVGMQYVDGICIEHHLSTEAAQQGYAGAAYANLGRRRVLAIAKTTADALLWAQVPGVTNVSDAQSYNTPLPPCVPAVRLDFSRK